MGVWLSRNNYVPTDKVHSDMFNSLANDDRQWGGNVNGGGYTLSNVVIAGLLTDPTQVKGDLIVRGNTGLTRLAVGVQGQVLTVDDQAPAGVKWVTGAGGGGGIPPNNTSTQRVRVSRVGVLVGTRQEVNFSPGANVSITVGDDPTNDRINIGIASTGGSGGMVDPTQAKGDLIVRGQSPPVSNLPVGQNGFVLTADSTQLLGVKWAAIPPAGFTDPTQAKGDLIVRGSAAPATRLPIGNDGFILTADQNSTLGVKWAAAPVSGVPPTRVISAGYGLTGGGDLTADRSFVVVDEASIQKVRVSLGGELRGTQPQLDFIAGSNVTMSVNQDTGGKKVTVQIASTGGGSGGGMTDPTALRGDMIVRGPTDISALPIGTGTDGYVLTVDSAVPLGVKWAVAAAGGQSQTPWLSDIIGNGHTLSDARIVANHPLAVVADSGGNLTMAMQTQAGLNRWALGKTADAASDFFLARYSDAGSFLDSPIGIARATGNITMGHDVAVSGALACSENLNAGGTVIASSVNITGDYLKNGAVWNPQSPWVADIDGSNFNLDGVTRISTNLLRFRHLGGPPSSGYNAEINTWGDELNINSEGNAFAKVNLFGMSAVQFYTAPLWTLRMKIAGTTGFVSIGHQTPEFLLDVRKDASPAANSLNAQVAIGSSTSTKRLLLGYDTSADFGYMQSIQHGVAVKPLVINLGGGDVGIGRTPSFRFDVAGDINITGSYSYRVNGVPIGTGGQTPWTSDINGAGFRLFSTGNVGVGNSLATLPDTSGSTTHLVVGQTTGGVGAITACGNASASGSWLGALQFANYARTGADKRVALFGGVVDGNADSGALVFYTVNSGTLGERMRITAGGTVAINTSMPLSSQLHIAGDPATFATTTISAGTGILDLVAISIGSASYTSLCSNLYYTGAAWNLRRTSVDAWMQAMNTGAGSGWGVYHAPAGALNATLTGYLNIGANGEIGMGATTPSAYHRLHLLKNSSGNPATSGTTPSVGSMLRLQAYDIGLDFGIYDNAAWWIQGYGSVTTNLANVQHLIFQPNGGSIGIGKYPSQQLDCSGNINAGGLYYTKGVAGASVTVQAAGATYGTQPIINFMNGASSSVGVTNDAPNNRVNVAYNFTSDARMKENVQDLEGGLAVIERIRPVAFEYNGSMGYERGKRSVSILAQELREILPDSVYTVKQKLKPEDEEETDVLCYDPIHLLTHLILAVKQLKQQIKGGTQ